ncbi:chemotaxis protein [Prosthecomicrobium hirschii]|uniref:methyl-accepting chemotaxis protein n=1 Tax=Prosthecodimorpha hirschii TaxID=665126 RepID=UPI00112A5226|nr:methyl-accepting chemotaxis protein [Prosthecomicrobium hirschii]TPQ48292.1 chemotaxis protein [Prosthecomicrobium hirschii]
MFRRFLALRSQSAAMPAVGSSAQEDTGAPDRQATTSQATTSQTTTSQAAIADVVALIEGDLKRAETRLAGVVQAMLQAAGTSAEAATAIRSDAGRLAGETETARNDMVGLAEAIGSFATANGEVGRQAQQSDRLVAEAEDAGAAATRSVADLQGAVGQIQSVVTLIADVAGQTNLLALNATIEAARAGAAGRGFAVVASEVKALSVETRKATDEISRRIATLHQTAETSIAAVSRVIETIGRIRPAAAAVAGAVAAQEARIAEASRSATETTGFTEGVATRAQSIRAATDQAVRVGQDVEAAGNAIGRSVQDMTRQLVTVLRQTPEADRRRFDRWPVERTGQFRGRHAATVKTVDLSLGGVLVAVSGEAPRVGEPVSLDIAGVGSVDGHVVANSPLGCHIAFRAPVPAGVAACVVAVAAEFEQGIARAKRGAGAIGETLAAAIRRGELSSADLFDTDYSAIPDSNPQQYANRALVSLDRLLPPIQEPLLAEDSRMTFAAAVDVNGWLPVHNRIYSHPQRRGDPVWNAANARNRRIFDDRAGLLAARNMRPFLVQSYPRDLGGGKIVMMKEIDVPILVDGRHWGGFRTAYRY